MHEEGVKMKKNSFFATDSLSLSLYFLRIRQLKAALKGFFSGWWKKNPFFSFNFFVSGENAIFSHSSGKIPAVKGFKKREREDIKICECDRHWIFTFHFHPSLLCGINLKVKKNSFHGQSRYSISSTKEHFFHFLLQHVRKRRASCC